MRGMNTVGRAIRSPRMAAPNTHGLAVSGVVADQVHAALASSSTSRTAVLLTVPWTVMTRPRGPAIIPRKASSRRAGFEVRRKLRESNPRRTSSAPLETVTRPGGRSPPVSRKVSGTATITGSASDRFAMSFVAARSRSGAGRSRTNGRTEPRRSVTPIDATGAWLSPRSTSTLTRGARNMRTPAPRRARMRLWPATRSRRLALGLSILLLPALLSIPPLLAYDDPGSDGGQVAEPIGGTAPDPQSAPPSDTTPRDDYTQSAGSAANEQHQHEEQARVDRCQAGSDAPECQPKEQDPAGTGPAQGDTTGQPPEVEV